MTKYRKRPLIVEAIQWTGDNTPEVSAFLGDRLMGYSNSHDYLVFRTHPFKASYRVNPGDWVVKDIDGEFVAVRPEVFEVAYEKVVRSQD